MTSKEIVSNYLQQVWVRRDLESLDQYVAEDLVQHNAGLRDGVEGLRGLLANLFNEVMPQLEWRVLRVVAEDDLVVSHSHTIPAAGARGMVVVDIFRISGDKIVEHWDVTGEVPEQTASGHTVY